MTDEQLCRYLGVSPFNPALIKKITPLQRKTYERMAEVETEINLWQVGLGPRPRGVLIDYARTPRRAKAVASGLRKRAQERSRCPP